MGLRKSFKGFVVNKFYELFYKMNKRILIIGLKGLIGSNLFDYFKIKKLILILTFWTVKKGTQYGK